MGFNIVLFDRSKSGKSMFSARFLAEVVASFEIAADLRATRVDLATFHRIEKAALLLKRQREKLMRPAGGVVTARQAKGFRIDARFSADVFDGDEDRKRPTAGAAFIAFVAERLSSWINPVRH